MTGTQGDVQSDAMKDLMQRLAALNATPAVLDTRQGDEEVEEQEKHLAQLPLQHPDS